MKHFDPAPLLEYHLRLLTPQQADDVRRDIAADPHLAAESEQIAATLRHIRRQPSHPITAAVADHHWQRLRPHLVAPRKAPRFGAWRWPLLFAGAATVLGTAVVLFVAPHAKQSTPNLPASSTQTTPTPRSPLPHPTTSPRVAYAFYKPHNPALVIPPVCLTHNTHQLVRFREAAYETPPVAATMPTTNTLPNLPAASSTVSAALIAHPKPPANSHRFHTQTDVGAAAFGSFITSRNSNFTSGSGPSQQVSFEGRSASPSAGLDIFLHQQFSRWVGYRINFGTTHDTFTYNGAAANAIGAVYGSESTNNTTREITGTYNVAGPRRNRFSTSFEVGGGTLVFIPAPGTSLRTNWRPTAVSGVGADIRLTQHLSLHTEYRGLVFKTPSYRALNDSRYTLASEPTVGITYHFGRQTPSPTQ